MSKDLTDDYSTFVMPWCRKNGKAAAITWAKFEFDFSLFERFLFTYIVWGYFASTRAFVALQFYFLFRIYTNLLKYVLIDGEICL